MNDTSPVPLHETESGSTSVLPRGVVRSDPSGRQLVDALAGRSSCFGFGFRPVVEAIQTASPQYLGDGSAFEHQAIEDDRLTAVLRDLLGDSSGVQTDSILLEPSPDQAVDRAIQLLRAHDSDSRYRAIALVGSDHGRTALDRTASGRPELSDDLGPLMSGFSHLPQGDLESIAAAIDDQTAGILLSPVDFDDSGRWVDQRFLTGVRELCDQHRLLLVVDETQVAFGASGKPFSFSSIADVRADLVVVAAGLFGGLPGGLIIGSQQATGGPIKDTATYPLLSSVAAATLAAATELNLLSSVSEAANRFSAGLAECLSQFEFVRDIHAHGMTLSVETDIEAEVLVETAAASGLRIEAAGDIAFRLQPPPIISADDERLLLERLVAAMQKVERATANVAAE